MDSKQMKAKAKEAGSLSEGDKHMMFNCLPNTSHWGGREFYFQGLEDALAAFNAAPQAAAAPTTVRLWAYGGSTGINDYLMSDGSIKTMTTEEAKGHAAPADSERSRLEKLVEMAREQAAGSALVWSHTQGRVVSVKRPPLPEPALDTVGDEVSWNLKYADSTPKLNVGNSAFEDWFQQQPFATQIGVKQMCRDAYAAGMGDPLVTYAHPPASKPQTQREADSTAPWLTKAHMLCTDHGVPQGNIEWRLEVLRALYATPQASEPQAQGTAAHLTALLHKHKSSALPEGACETCDGEGEIGGQFCGGYQECPDCAGTGKKPNHLPASGTQAEGKAIPHSGADESPPVFGRRWKIAADGFGLQRDDLNGRYVDIDDALSVLHAAQPQVPEEDVEEIDAHAEFEEWWKKYGQFCRTGGGAREKEFAWNAWLYLLVRLSNDAEKPHASRPQAPEKVKLTRLQQECLRIGEEIQRASRDLPQGYKLEVYVEPGYGCVYLRDPDGEHTTFSDTVDGLSRCITKAIDHAKNPTT